MSKKNKKTETAIIDVINENVEIIETAMAAPETEVINAPKKLGVAVDEETGRMVSVNGKLLGRPADPNSKAQIAKRELMERRAAGLVKRGRPANPESKNYQKNLERKAKAEAGLLTGERGRPINPNSNRQQIIATRQAMYATGVWNGKPGRPKVVKTEE